MIRTDWCNGRDKGNNAGLNRNILTSPPVLIQCHCHRGHADELLFFYQWDYKQTVRGRQRSNPRWRDKLPRPEQVHGETLTAERVLRTRQKVRATSRQTLQFILLTSVPLNMIIIIIINLVWSAFQGTQWCISNTKESFFLSSFRVSKHVGVICFEWYVSAWLWVLFFFSGALLGFGYEYLESYTDNYPRSFGAFSFQTPWSLWEAAATLSWISATSKPANLYLFIAASEHISPPPLALNHCFL